MKRYCMLALQSQQAHYSPIVSHAISMISTCFMEALSLQDVASQIKVSSGYLSALLKQETGKSFSDFLAEKRIDYAKLLLSQTDLPITALCAECGIPDNNYFSRFFKQHVGVTPKQYRYQQNAPEHCGANSRIE